MKIIAPLAFALLAAIGNAVFVAGQKKALDFDNPFTFVVLSAAVFFVLTALVVPLYGQPNYVEAIKQNGFWAALSGAGLFLVFVGFNLLYAKYGASSYILYAVLSIISTVVVVGVIIFKEDFNFYHWLALGASIVTIVLFSVGNLVEKT